MEEMVFICPECHSLAYYDPCLKRVYCRNTDCEWSESIYLLQQDNTLCFACENRVAV